jgi:midasin
MAGRTEPTKDVPIREISSKFHNLFFGSNQTSLSKSLENLREFSQSNVTTTTANEAQLKSIKDSFRTLKEELEYVGIENDDALLVSLLIDTFILPCYRFYSTHRIFSSAFFQLFNRLFVHNSISENINYHFSITAIVSRSKLYPPTQIMTIKEWSKEKWLGKSLGMDPSTKVERFKSGRAFPFSANSKIYQTISNPVTFPTDIAEQYAVFLENARNKSRKNDDELTYLQGVLVQLCREDFIKEALINDNHCLSLILSFALKRHRIGKIEVVDRNKTQEEGLLKSMANQFVNQLEYKPNQKISVDCKVKWTDEQEFFYSNNDIRARPTFLEPLAKLLLYASRQLDNPEKRSQWNFLLEKIQQTALDYFLSSPKFAEDDIKEFFLFIFNNGDIAIQEMSTKLICSLIDDLELSEDVLLTPVVTSNIITSLIETRITKQTFEIDPILLNDCLKVSTKWDVDDVCHLLSMLALRLSEISKKTKEISANHQQYYGFFVDLIHRNFDRLLLPMTKSTTSFQEFCQNIHQSLFIQLFYSNLNNLQNPLEFIIQFHEDDWITILLDILSTDQNNQQVQMLNIRLLEVCHLHSFHRWEISTSLKSFFQLIGMYRQNYRLLNELLQLLQKIFETQSIQKLHSSAIDFAELCQSLIDILRQIFNNEKKNTFLDDFAFRRRLLSTTTLVLLQFINQKFFKTSINFSDDMNIIVQSTLFLSIEYKEMLKFCLFLIESKQQNLVEYWLEQLLFLSLITNENFQENDNENFQQINSRPFSYYLQPTVSVDYLGIYKHESIKFLEEKLQHTVHFLSFSIFQFLSLFVQQSISLFFSSLLHQESTVRLNIARLLSIALSIQPNDLTKLLTTMKGKNDTHFQENTSMSLNVQSTRDQTCPYSTYLVERENFRLNSKISFCLINRADFQNLIDDLEKTLTDEDLSQQNDSSLNQIEQLTSQCPLGMRSLIPKHDMFPKLVQTKTMLLNRKRILECIRTPIHLLLQGETGVGKTSLILDVAADLQRPLIRFNLSSKTDVATLFGSFKFKEKNGIELDFEEGPFTYAYCHGLWLLLDEMNLASPNVLQAMEQAIESGVLILPNVENEDKSQTEVNYRTYKMHPEFRLFATQNPSIGQYKGARDQQSAALLNRFSIFIVDAPETTELVKIIQSRLTLQNVPFTDLTDSMVKLHENLMKLVKSADFPENNRNYGEITIRELFRWCQSLCNNYQKMFANTVQSIENLPSNEFDSIIIEQAFIIYGARFRQQISQQKIANEIERVFRTKPVFDRALTIDFQTPDKIVFRLNQRFLLQISVISDKRILDEWPCQLSKPHRTEELARIIEIHNFAFRTLHEGDKLQQIYDCSYALLWSVLEKHYGEEHAVLSRLLMETYSNLCRNQAQRDKIIQHITQKYSKSDIDVRESIPPLSSARPAFYLDNEASRIVQYILSSSPTQPILIVGPEGSGKSHLVQSIATVAQIRCRHLYLTPQTEPSALVGSIVPHPEFPKWQDGTVSEAAEKGYWLILENFSEASSAVLERLNSILEQPAQWVKVENNETMPVKISPQFRIIATMSPPTERLQNASIETNHELTPALYNRFLILYYSGLKVTSIETYRHLFRSYFPIDDEPLINYLYDQLKSEQITIRHIVQWFDCSFQLRHSIFMPNPQPNLYSALLAGLELVFPKETTISTNIKTYLREKAQPNSINFFDIYVTPEQRQKHREHIIDPIRTRTRYEAAKRLCAAVICSRPVLLEGPAATGKTSLVEYLAHCQNKRLYRVNNTKGTTVQDYFGSYMPNGQFLPGALSCAMSEGHWFVADEFDLAEPAVMNVLYPILEGQKHLTVPNTGRVLLAQDGFRFFATQNGTTYVGRKQLPKTLRSRFLEIFFENFSQDELTYIIKQRKLSDFGELHLDLEKFAPCIASTITIVNEYIEKNRPGLLGAPKLILTMREVIKWIRRKQQKPHVSWEEHALRLLESRIPKQYYQDFLVCLKDQRALPGLIDAPIQIEIDQEQISLFRSPDLTISYDFLNREAVEQMQLSSAPKSFLLALWRIFAAVEQHEPVLLLGPTCYKSHLIKVWAKLTNRQSNICTITCSTSTETNDLIGSIR